MGASIARKRIRLGPRVLRHQLAQVCASGCCNGSLFYFIYLFIFTLLGVIINSADKAANGAKHCDAAFVELRALTRTSKACFEGQNANKSIY